MEPEGARRIFTRSIEIRRVRYTSFYGDGDSKAFHVEDIYENIKVVKFECRALPEEGRLSLTETKKTFNRSKIFSMITTKRG